MIKSHTYIAFLMRKLLKPALLAFLVILDLGIEEWKRGGLLSPHTPFTLPMAADAMGNPSSRIRSAVEVYFADRGGQLNVDGRKGEKLTIFYFEWDQVDAGSIIEIAGHPPERCNVAAGFAHLGRDPVRRYYLSNGDELIFEVLPQNLCGFAESFPVAEARSSPRSSGRAA